MTPALRKRHQRTWWFLGLALLLIWGTSIIVINKNEVTLSQSSTSPSAKMTIELKKGRLPNTQRVSLQIPQPFASPQTLVYLTDKKTNEVGKSQLLGRIDGVGTFEFPLDSMSTAMPQKIIKGYDAIHQKELFSVILND